MVGDDVVGEGDIGRPGQPDSEVAGRHAEVAPQLNDHNAGKAPTHDGRGAVGRAIVEQDDRHLMARQRVSQVVAAVPGGNHHCYPYEPVRPTEPSDSPRPAILHSLCDTLLP